MALDPVIPLNVGRGVTQPEDFLTAGVQAAQLGNQTAVAMQRVQQAKDMAAINAAFAQAQGDPDQTTALLNQSGSATASAMWQQNVNAQRKQLADQHDQALKSTAAGFGIASQVANTLDSTSTPEQYAAAKLAISGVMGQQGKPILDAVMPDNPNPSDIPGIVSKVQGLSQTAKEHIDAARQAVQDFSDGKTQSAVARSLAMINTGDPQQDLQQRGAMLNTLHERYGSTIDPILQSFVPLIKQGAAPGDILSAGGIKPTETVVGKGATLVQTPVGGGTPTAVFTAPSGPPTNTAELAMDAANANSATQAQSQAALAKIQALHPASTGAPGSSASDPKDIADAIIRGEQPPVLTGLYRNASPVRAELARQGYDLSKATEDWTATQKYLGTLNGQQQTRLRQAINFTGSSLDIVEDLAKQWGAGGFPLLNSAQLGLARQGALGPQAQQIATKMTAQIADLTSELGTVYKGGNSSTDESLKLAAQNLQTNWSRDTLLANTAQIRKNLAIRQNSMSLAGGPAGVTPNNPYVPGGTPSPSVTTPAPVTKTFYFNGKPFTATGPAGGPFTSASGGVYDAQGNRIK